MTDRDRLIELLIEAEDICDRTLDCDECEYNQSVNCCRIELNADHLLANGVIVPPCKVGDKLYIVTNVSQEIAESIVIGLWMADGVFSLLSIHGTIITDNIGKTVFLTKEEAEQALKDKGKEDEGNEEGIFDCQY